MSKTKKRRKQTSKVPSGAKALLIHFSFMAEPFKAGQIAGLEALKSLPTCHEECTTSALLSFWLGIMLPGCRSETEIKRLSMALLPHLLESMSIACVPSTNPEACMPAGATVN
jgi:hypothetical protein